MSEAIRQLHEIYTVKESSGPAKRIITLSDPRDKHFTVAMCFGRRLEDAYEVACRLIPQDTQDDNYGDLLRQLDEERGKRLRLESEKTDLQMQLEEMHKRVGGRANVVKHLNEASEELRPKRRTKKKAITTEG